MIRPAISSGSPRRPSGKDTGAPLSDEVAPLPEQVEPHCNRACSIKEVARDSCSSTRLGNWAGVSNIIQTRPHNRLRLSNTELFQSFLLTKGSDLRRGFACPSRLI